jgi:hypothetical protein
MSARSLRIENALDRRHNEIVVISSLAGNFRAGFASASE